MNSNSFNFIDVELKFVVVVERCPLTYFEVTTMCDIFAQKNGLFLSVSKISHEPLNRYLTGCTTSAVSKFRRCMLWKLIRSQQCVEGCPNLKGPPIAAGKYVFLFPWLEGRVSPPYLKMHWGPAGRLFAWNSGQNEIKLIISNINNINMCNILLILTLFWSSLLLFRAVTVGRQQYIGWDKGGNKTEGNTVQIHSHIFPSSRSTKGSALVDWVGRVLQRTHSLSLDTAFISLSVSQTNWRWLPQLIYTSQHRNEFNSVRLRISR